MLTSLSFVSISFYQNDCILSFALIKHDYNDNKAMFGTDNDVGCND